jgi:D-arginine dehydrogenase
VDCEVAIVGGGIAGASLAYFLAQRGVLACVIEREPQPGCHATGRSASVLCELDPIPTLRALKVMGGAFLRQPPAGFSDDPLLVASGILELYAPAEWDAAQPLVPTLRAEGIRVEAWSASTACGRVDVLDARRFAGALWLPDSGRIDVHALLTGYLAGMRRGRGRLITGVEAVGLVVEDGRCRGVRTGAGEVRADWVVDAAGAWAGLVSRGAGAAPVALQPLRRSAAVFEVPSGVDARGWPLVASEAHAVYFEPDGAELLMSPMDEQPMSPCDARPEPEVIAAGFERLAALAPRLVPRAVRRTWAGLRTFAPDRIPVVGADPALPGLFWLAGQGGCGIETSAALGAIAADLLVDGGTERFDARRLAPGRPGLRA